MSESNNNWWWIAILILLPLSMCIRTGSCAKEWQNPRKELTEMAEMLKNGGKITSYSFEGDTLQLNLLMPENGELDMDSLAKYPDLFKQYCLDKLPSQLNIEIEIKDYTLDDLEQRHVDFVYDDGKIKLVKKNTSILSADKLKRAQAFLAFDFSKQSSGKHAHFIVSPEDITKIDDANISKDFGSSDSFYNNRLLLYVEASNKLYDNRSGFDTKTDIDNAYLSLEDNYLLVHFVMKEDLSSVPVISTKAEALKDTLKEFVRGDAFKEIISLAVQTNRGAKLVIHGKKTGATATATLSSDELKNL